MTDSFSVPEIMFLKGYVMARMKLTSRQVFIDQEESQRFELDYIDITFIDAARARTSFYKHLLSQGIFCASRPPFKYSKTTQTKNRKYMIRIEGSEAFRWFNLINQMIGVEK
jgi:hypothetical protein